MAFFWRDRTPVARHRLSHATCTTLFVIRLDTATEARLASAAARLGEAPDALAARAVRSCLEDLEDYASAAEAWAELDPAAVRSLADMKAALNLTG